MTRFRTEIIGEARLILGDCREVMADFPPCFRVDAVVTDPPYGIGESNAKNMSRGTVTTKVRLSAARDYGEFSWDKETIDEETMGRVRSMGKYQIIFGGNYYTLPPSSCWLVWDKLQSGDFADCELAWTNLPKAIRRIVYLWNGCMRANGETRGDHPTQKPIGVMRWCLAQLPVGTRAILDPFMGSGTTGVAAMLDGFSFIGIERDERYFDAACRRIAEAHKQPRLFAEPLPKVEQGALSL